MSKQRRSNCRDCGASGNDVHISQAGLCPTCGDERLAANVTAMRAMSGYQADRWRAGMANAAARQKWAELDASAALNGGGTSDRSAAPPQP